MSSGPLAHTGYTVQQSSPIGSVAYVTFENSKKQVHYQRIQCAVGDECHTHRVLRLINWLVCWSFGFRVEHNCFSWCNGRSSRRCCSKAVAPPQLVAQKEKKGKRRKDSVIIPLSFVFAQVCTFNFFLSCNERNAKSFVLFVCFVYTKEHF